MQRDSLPITSHLTGAHANGIPSTLSGVRLITLGVASALVLGVAGCGSVASAPDESQAKAVELKVSPGKFSKTDQRPGDEVTLSLTVTNSGSNPTDDFVVQLEGLEESTIAKPGDETRERTEKDDLPDSTERAAWFIDEAPNGGSFSESNLYPGGPLAPGRSRTLRWRMNAAQPGTHTIKYQVYGGLSDNEAKATSGTGLTGSVTGTISEK